jgi:hypothetical protein
MFSVLLVFLFLIDLFFRSTEHDHVKDNLPAKLLRIRTFGKMKLEEFKDLISIGDYKTCESKMEKNPTWYPLTLDVFVKFLYKVILLIFLLPFSSLQFIPSPCTYMCILQREISNAADTAARLYREATPEDRRSAPEIWNVMTKAQEKLIKNIRTRNFEKYISVAHKDNGEDFFQEVPPWVAFKFMSFCLRILVVLVFVMILIYRSHSSQIDRHFSTFLVSDMSIEKLQKVATTHVDASVKARWLRWWNSPADVKAKNKFPTSLPLREKVLEDWLHKASFWAQVFHFTILKFDEFWVGSIHFKAVQGGGWFIYGPSRNREGL